MKPLIFKLNEPQVLKLADSVPDRDGCNWVFRTSDGNCIELPRVAAQQIAALQIEPGEEISIGRYRQSTQEPAEWTVALTPRTEQERAKRETPELERKLADSIQLANLRRMTKAADSPALEPAEPLKGTGTYGPAPRASAGARTPPPRVSYRVALREITDTVLELLDARKEQWESDPRQGIISTLFISACKSGAVVFDFQGDGGKP